MKAEKETDRYSTLTDSQLFGRVVYIGPTLRADGGIATVLRSYRDMLPAFRHIATNSRFGPLGSAVKMAALMVRLPLMKLAGGTDILHIHGATGKSWMRKSLIIRWGAFLGFKTVYHSHGGSMAEYSQRYGREKMGRTLRRCAAIATLSHYWRHFFSETFGHPNVAVINNVVERPADEELHTAAPRRMLPSENAPLRLLFLGAINEKKGIFDLVETIAAHAGDWRGRVILEVGGDGPMMTQLREMLKQRGIDEMIRLHGWISGSDKENLFKQCDAIVLPSYIEGMPISILEGMARAMPVIASNVGGIPEIVTDGVNGFIFAPGDTHALASAINAYLSTDGLLARHGAESLLRAEPFLPEAVIASLASLYRSL